MLTHVDRQTRERVRGLSRQPCQRLVDIFAGPSDDADEPVGEADCFAVDLGGLAVDARRLQVGSLGRDREKESVSGAADCGRRYGNLSPDLRGELKVSGMDLGRIRVRAGLGVPPLLGLGPRGSCCSPGACFVFAVALRTCGLLHEVYQWLSICQVEGDLSPP